MANPLTDVPETEPSKVIVGDTLQWKRTDLGADYPNDAYTLSYAARLEADGTTAITITASASGNDYLVSVAAATTAAYTAGVYHWSAFMTRNSDSARVTVDSGTFEVLANKAAAETDPRSHAKLMLDKIESLLEGRADGDVASYSIQGRSLTKLSISDLLMWRAKYKAEYKAELKREAIANGKGAGSKILYRFT